MQLRPKMCGNFISSNDFVIFTEKGKFMALDLGGTNFRVLVIDIDGDDFKMENEIFAIPQSIKIGTGDQV